MHRQGACEAPAHCTTEKQNLKVIQSKCVWKSCLKSHNVSPALLTLFLLSGSLCGVQNMVSKMQVKQSQTDFGDNVCTSQVSEHFLFDEERLQIHRKRWNFGNWKRGASTKCLTQSMTLLRGKRQSHCFSFWSWSSNVLLSLLIIFYQHSPDWRGTETHRCTKNVTKSR